jgi:hypothetical protein
MSVGGSFRKLQEMRPGEGAKEFAGELHWRLRIFAIRFVEDRVGDHVVAFEQQLKEPARLVFFDGSATNGQGIQPCGTTQHSARKRNGFR